MKSILLPGMLSLALLSGKATAQQSQPPKGPPGPAAASIRLEGLQLQLGGRAAEIAKVREEVEQLKKRLQETAERLRRLEAAPGSGAIQFVQPSPPPAGVPLQVQGALRMLAGKAKADGNREVIELLKQVIAKLEAQGVVSASQEGTGNFVIVGEANQAKPTPAKGGGFQIEFQLEPAKIRELESEKTRRQTETAQKRQQIEKRLELMLREVDEMRRELQKSGAK
jgi:TolA-binding protein